ncbi:MAG: histidine kinase, partial [Candidatus Delongbacteria bacterium]|nr:histidine kinase [Candidatus Delongbacteria bacterium]
EDRSGALWIGTIGGGLNKFDSENEKFIHYENDPNNPKSLSHNIVISIYEDNSGTIWIGTYGGGLNKFDKDKGSFLYYINDPDDPTSLSANRVLSIYEDRTGNLWISTWGGGLDKFDRKKELFTHYTHDPNDSTSISSNIIHSIYEDNKGFLWIGTEGGLNKFDRAEEIFISYRLSDGLPNEMVYGLLEDDNGNFWLSTSYGLSRFNPTTEEFRNYDTRDGLQDNVFDFKAYQATNSGEFIFGGVNGLTLFHPDSLVDNTHIPPLILTDFQLFNESVPVGFDKNRERTILNNSITVSRELELTYEDKVFSFEFAALDYRSPRKNKYAYQMVGVDPDWVNTDASRRFATYTNLDPGEYTFKVKGSNNDGIWNEEGTSIRIIITPPWWKTNLAYTFYIFLVGFIVFSIWRFQTNRLKMRHQMEMDHLHTEKLEEVDRLKSRFFANISHE